MAKSFGFELNRSERRLLSKPPNFPQEEMYDKYKGGYVDPAVEYDLEDAQNEFADHINQIFGVGVEPEAEKEPLGKSEKALVAVCSLVLVGTVSFVAGQQIVQQIADCLRSLGQL